MLALSLAAILIAPLSLPSASDIATLRHVVDRVVSKYPMNTATLSVSVVEAGTGRVLFERNAGTELAPASNFKLLDAASALAYLGPNFRYRTELRASGSIADGTLDGDLVLVGGGDPVLKRAVLAEAVRAVAAAGIRRVMGTVVVDDSLFDEQRYGPGWAWDDMSYYYQPPIQALSVDEGLAQVTVAPGNAAGAPVIASIEPNGSAMNIRSEAATSAAGGINDVDCFRSPGSSLIRIVGHYPLDAKPFTFGCAVDDAPAYAAGTLKQLLRDASISIGDAAAGPRPPEGPLDIENPIPLEHAHAARVLAPLLLWAHESPPVKDLLARMMPVSDNFIAEHLFKMLPVAELHQRGTFDGGAAVERKFLSSLGLDARTLDGGDGSGLSQGDRITAHDLTAILRWEMRSSTGGYFIHALARAGVNGTVRHHLRGSDAIGRVRAKDGYIWHVSTFSGYAMTRKHGLIVFSVMFNNAVGDLKPFLSAEDQIVETIVDWR